MTLPIDNGAEPFKGVTVVAELPAEGCPRDLELYVRGAVRRVASGGSVTLYPFPARLRYEPAKELTRDVARRCGVKRSDVRRWLSEGLTWREADLLACRSGLHPRTLWPEWDMPFMAWRRIEALDESWALRLEAREVAA